MNTAIHRSALCVALLSWCTFAAAESREWKFTALLDGKEIGYHNFTLKETGTSRTLKSEARFDVKILRINFYKYVHDDTEIYDGDCLKSIDARTNDNGDKFIVRGALESTGFVTSDGKQTLGRCIMTYAYWNPQMLQAQQLLNSQTGKFERVSVEKVADESVQARGKSEQAIKYRISGDQLNIELWYSKDMQWLGLQSTTEDGRKLRYQLN